MTLLVFTIVAILGFEAGYAYELWKRAQRINDRAYSVIMPTPLPALATATRCANCDKEIEGHSTEVKGEIPMTPDFSLSVTMHLCQECTDDILPIQGAYSA